MSPNPTLRWLAATCALTLSVAGASHAQATDLSAKVKAVQAEQALKDLLATTERDDPKSKALAQLAEDLAEASLVPSVDLAKAEFGSVDAKGSVSVQAPLSFSVNSAFKERLKDAAQALTGSKAVSQTICFESPGAPRQQLRTSKAGQEVLLSALEVSDITPVVMHRAKVGEHMMMLSDAQLGRPLYALLRESLTSGAKELGLTLTPSPQLKPSRLSVTTIAGTRITIPVEIEGGAQRYEVNPRAQWVINGKRTRVNFDASKPGQALLMKHLSSNHKASLREITSAVHYPRFERTVGDVRSYTLHRMGRQRRWLGKVNFSVQAGLSAEHTAGSCSVVVRFEAEGSTMVRLGRLALEAWSEIGEVRVVSSDATSMAVGYLNAPECTSDAGEISLDDFDRWVTDKGTRHAPRLAPVNPTTGTLSVSRTLSTRTQLKQLRTPVKARVKTTGAETVTASCTPSPTAIKVLAIDARSWVPHRERAGPVKAEVYADGALLGTTGLRPTRFPVSVCVKEIEIRHPKYGSTKKQVQLKTGVTKRLRVKLRGTL